jgi:hypothetical protein
LAKTTPSPAAGATAVRARLAARALLEEQQLAALVVAAGLRERNDDLQRKRQGAVEILVQAVVVAGVVAQQQRCGPALAGGVTGVEILRQRRRNASGAWPSAAAHRRAVGTRRS